MIWGKWVKGGVVGATWAAMVGADQRALGTHSSLTRSSPVSTVSFSLCLLLLSLVSASAGLSSLPFSSPPSPSLLTYPLPPSLPLPHSDPAPPDTDPLQLPFAGCVLHSGLCPKLFRCSCPHYTAPSSHGPELPRDVVVGGSRPRRTFCLGHTYTKTGLSV